MDELKDLIELVGSTGFKGGVLWFAYRLIVRYLPNWQDKIERQRQQIALLRDLGVPNAEICRIITPQYALPPANENPRIALPKHTNARAVQTSNEEASKPP